MPQLSWNEVRDRAIRFSRNPEWVNATSERADKQTFYNEFFEVFGIRRASVAAFESNVRNLQGNLSAIDLFWRGKLIAEHKSRGESLSQAQTQAFGYIEDLTREGRSDEVPRFVLVSDFAHFVLYDLEPEEQRNLPLFAGRPISRLEFPLADFPRHVRAFAFMLGQNALRKDWNEVLPVRECAFVLGNPPFIGKKVRNSEQQADMDIVFGRIKGTGVLDYVCCWYLRAAQYIRNTQIRVGFVSTSSITQGEQPGLLWKILFGVGIKIHFAHRSFDWESEARGKAQLDVVIIGFGNFDLTSKRIYENDGATISISVANNISPYLVEGRDFALENREEPISSIPSMHFGSMPNDDGNFLLTDQEKAQLLRDEPEARSLIRPILSTEQYLHGENRWCIWLKDVAPSTVRRFPGILRRVEAVKNYRALSSRPATKKLADYPTLFGEIRQPSTPFILVPRHSSENRSFIPLSRFGPEFIVSDSCLCIPGGTLFHFGILSSTIHMAWVRLVCGRLESRYRYSNKLVYNNFPWPHPTPTQMERVEEKAQAVLAARAPHLPPRGMGTLADLYDPNTMPPELHRAHTELDRAVERCYRADRFQSDRERVEYLFRLYEQLTAPLLPVTPRARGRRQTTGETTPRPHRGRTPGLPAQHPPLI